MRWKDLSPDEAKALLASDPTVLVLDVRTPPEYESHHIEGSSLIPVQVLDQYFDRLDPKKPWLVVCEHGRRSVAACEFLAQQGFTDLRNLTGGLEAWVRARLPVGKGLPQEMQRPAPQGSGGGCGHGCGCVGKSQQLPQQEPAPARPERKGWLRSLLGR